MITWKSELHRKEALWKVYPVFCMHGIPIWHTLFLERNSQICIIIRDVARNKFQELLDFGVSTEFGHIYMLFRLS